MVTERGPDAQTQRDARLCRIRETKKQEQKSCSHEAKFPGSHCLSNRNLLFELTLKDASIEQARII
jgi:hypothetical protein